MANGKATRGKMYTAPPGAEFHQMPEETGYPQGVKGMEAACGIGEMSPLMPSIFGRVRSTLEFLQDALNNLNCVSSRLRLSAEDGCIPPQSNPSSLDDLLTECNYVARQILSESQEISGIVGE